jgi:peptidoglycan/LPS O-acetylase OafA/YrhL
MTQHVRFMDGLRGIAVLMVLLFHSHGLGVLPLTLQIGGGLLFELPRAFVNPGFMGVDLFFFLSGFALFYPYAQHLFEKRPLQSLGRYADRRISKILPSYLLALVFFTCTCPGNIPASGSAFQHFIRHLFFIHNFWSDSHYSISAPFWTLAIEAQFYLVFPLIAWCLMRAPWTTLGALSLLAAAYRMTLDTQGLATTGHFTDQLPAYLDVFGFGSMTAYVIVRDQNRELSLSESQVRIWTGVACAAAALLYSVLCTQDYCLGLPCAAWRNDAKGPVAMALFAMCVGISRGTPVLRHILESRFLLWFSAISYNLYLWNCEILSWYSRNQPAWLTNLPYGETISAAFILSSIIGTAWMLTMFIEQPFLRASLINRLRTTPRGTAP